MLLQSAPILAKKLLVDEKIAACVKQICLQLLFVKFRIEKNCLVKHFAFLKNVCYQIFKRCASSNLLFFNELLIGPQPTFRSVLLFSCNLIGQLCLCGPGYSSRTVK